MKRHPTPPPAAARTRRLTAAAALLVATAAAVPASAQSPTALAELIEVELVNVDVWVTDGRGDPLFGLERGDFEVLHDGSPVEITHFREVRDGRAAAAPSGGEAAAAPPSPAHVVVYFDQTRLRPTNYGPLIRALRSLLASESIAPERVLVLRQQRGLSVAQPFGSSQAELEAALEQIASSPPPGFDADSETRLAVDAIRDAWDRVQESLGSMQRGIAGIPASTPGDTGAGGGGSPRDAVAAPARAPAPTPAARSCPRSGRRSIPGPGRGARRSPSPSTTSATRRGSSPGCPASSCCSI